MIAQRQVLSLQPSEAEVPRLYIGIDVAKNNHVAALISSELLEKHRKFEKCPTFSFGNHRAGFEKLARSMQLHAPLVRCVILLERTGHYHRSLMEYLIEQGCIVYDIQVQIRVNRDKSDKRDALGLANTLYVQLALGAQADEPWRRIRRVEPPSQAALQLRSLVLQHHDLTQAATQCKNKLTAIADQLFPEATEIFKDINGMSALNLREKFATPAQLALASLDDLKACCPGVRPGRAQLARLQELARSSIGVKDPLLCDALVFEQRQLIGQLRMHEEHIAAIEARIAGIAEDCREGTILLSLPMIGPLAAAAIIAHVGCIGNFESAAQLRRYFGWAPQSDQTGTTQDRRTLSRAGSHTMKRMLYLVAWTAIRKDTEWRILYERLVEKKCSYDARLKRYRGKNKVIGRIAGQIVSLIYHLLRKDYDMLCNLKPGEDIPPPTLYDRKLHEAHRQRRKLR
jgi:transposase